MKPVELLAHFTAKFSSGNAVPVDSTIVNRQEYRMLIDVLAQAMEDEKDAARFRHILANDITDLFQYGGDSEEIRQGIDYAIHNPEKHENVPLDSIRGILK